MKFNQITILVISIIIAYPITIIFEKINNKNYSELKGYLIITILLFVIFGFLLYLKNKIYMS